MDEPPRPMDRWLLLIGIVLLVEAGLGFLPAVLPGGHHIIVHFGSCGLIAAAGATTLLVSRRPPSSGVLRIFLGITFLALTGTRIASFADFSSLSYAGAYSFWIFGNLTAFLLLFGVPILWGSALARREDPGNLKSQKAGRISAGLVQLSFVFLFASEIRAWGQLGLMGTGYATSVMAAYGVLQLSQIANRVLLLWGSIESVREATDEEVIRRRALKIHRLLLAWFGLAILSRILSDLVMALQWTPSVSSQASLWRMAVHYTITFAATLAVALTYRAQRVGYKSEAPGNPLTGAEV